MINDVFTVVITLSVVTIILQAVYIKLLKRQFKNTPTQPSAELSDFLRDVQTHGYGFVRVNPDNVFMRK